jgi:hypothetical protein
MSLTTVKHQQGTIAQSKRLSTGLLLGNRLINAKAPRRTEAERSDIAATPMFIITMPTHVFRTINVSIEQEKIEHLPRCLFHPSF